MNEIQRRFLTFYDDIGELVGRYEVSQVEGSGRYWVTYHDKVGSPWVKFVEIDGTEHTIKLGGLRWTFGVKVETLH